MQLRCPSERDSALGSCRSSLYHHIGLLSSLLRDPASLYPWVG
jgi:hypothetical protein